MCYTTENFLCKKLLKLYNEKYGEEHRCIRKIGRATIPLEITIKLAQIPAPAQHQAHPQPALVVPSPLPIPAIANLIHLQPVTALKTPLPAPKLPVPAQPSYLQPQPTTSSVQLQHLPFQTQYKPLAAPVSVIAQRQCDRF